MNILDKTRLLQTSILSSLMMGLGGVAYAQVDTTPAEVEQIEAEEEDDFAEEKGEIVVTGSRLRRNEFTSASPLQVIDGELARDLGLVDASDLLGQTTVVQGQQITTGLSTSAGNLSANGPGSATASLRGLNPGRTLVLVNGRRLAPAGVRGAPSAPDLNLIPGSLVQRVDVLLDGASSVYGSDAIAGVVNYQLQREFEGIEVDAYATIPELPGNAGHREVFSLKTGVSNDKGFVTFAAEHSRVAGYNEAALSDFYSPYSNGCLSYVTQGASGTIYDPDRCAGSFGAGSAITPLGYLGYLEGNTGEVVSGFTLPDNFTRIAVTGNLIQPDDADGQRLLIFPEELDAAFAPDFNRTSMFTFGEYDTGLYGNMTAYFEASYATRETKTNTAGQGAINLPGSYPLNQIDVLGLDSTLFFQSRFINDTNVAQTRFISGLKGDLPFLEGAGLNNWAYDVSASYSRSSGQDAVKGIPFFPRLAQTLNNTVVDATTGEVSCTPVTVAGADQDVPCRPLNFFEPTFLFTGEFDDPEDTEYLFPNRLTDTIVKQNILQGYVSGDLFDIPTGDTVKAGFGGEYREDIIETRTSLAGDFEGFFNDPGSNGRRTLHEVFGEISIPLVKERYGIHELTVDLAGRYTDESNFGSAETYSVKGVFAPTDWLSFRASYGTSFRAPNLGEQFGGRVTGFANPSDPCRVPGVAVPFQDTDGDGEDDRRIYDANLDPRDPDIIANCQNGGGPFGLAATDPFNLGANGIGTSSTPFFYGSPTRVATGSNPALKPETSTAISVGGSFDQPWFEDFDFRIAVNYFEIEITDEVNQLTASTIVNRCYNSAGLTDPTCEFIDRAARDANDPTSGEVTFVSALNQNLGAQFVEGIDYNAEFGFDFKAPFSDDQFDYNLIFRATQSLRQDIEEAIISGVNINDNLGEYGNPKWRLNFTQQLTWKDFGFLFQSRYLDSMVENVIESERNDPVTTSFSRCVQEEGRGTVDNRTCRQYDDLASYWLHSASVSYSKDTYVLRAGVSNVFDTAPPLTDNNNLGSLAGIGYDIGGRTFFVNATKKF